MIKQPRCLILTLLAILIVFHGFKVVKSDISDDECGVLIEEETTTVKSSTDKPLNKFANRNGTDFKKRIKKKSLLIVFDGTSSMTDDLVQMRDAAKEIISNLANIKEKPIKNYVLVVFKDPVNYFLPTVNTMNHQELFTALDNIKLGNPGNYDYPELSLTGLKYALEHATDHSLAYVFTDAAAKDYADYDKILPIIQKKQVKVNFLVTPGHGSKSDPNYVVYDKIAAASEGQVFDVRRDALKQILLTITQALDPKFEPLVSYNSKTAGSMTKSVKVDQSFSSVSVSLSGLNSQLSVKDSNNDDVKSSGGFSSDNIKFMTFSVSGSSYTIQASAQSAYSIRVGGISELKFEFGFSTIHPTEQGETAVQPLVGHENILSIFVSDHELIKCLVKAVLLPANADDSFPELDIPLIRLKRNFYSSNPFAIPTKMFKIRIFGYDKKGVVIDRIISSGIESVSGLPPEVEIEPSSYVVNQYSTFNIVCKVMSLTPATASLMFESKISETKKSNQSTEIQMIIENFQTENVGKYICMGENKLGKDVKEVTVQIALAPLVKVIPEKLDLKEGETGTINCEISNAKGVPNFFWYDEFGELSQKGKTSYEFTATRKHHNKNITCEVEDGEFLITKNTSLTVEYSPEFLIAPNPQKPIKRRFSSGDYVKLNCSTDENPKGTVKWYFNDEKDFENMELVDNDSRMMELFDLKASQENSIYKCTVENYLGKTTKKFEFIYFPNEKPEITTEKEVVVKKDQKAELKCSCKDCQPVTKYYWKRKDQKKIRHKITRSDDFDNNDFATILTIKTSDETDEGVYECAIYNKRGKDKTEVDVLVQYPPRKLTIVVNDQKLTEIKRDFVIKEFKDFTLECIGQAYPIPTISWTKDGKNIGRGSKLELLESNMSKNEGVYRCTIENSLDSIAKDIHVKVQIEPFVFNENKLSIEMKENQEVSLYCDINGSPEPNISWNLNSIPLDDTQNYSINGKHLKFNGNKDNTGIYSCTGVNEFGTATMKFDVNYIGPPSIFSPEDEKIKATLFERLTLSCDATGFPEPIIFWTKEGNKIKDGKTIVFEEVKGTDLGIYTCNAENVAGLSRKNFEVYAAEFPSFIFPFQNITVPKGNSSNLECYAYGYPNPTIIWTFNGEKIKEGESLLLDASMEPGLYACIAENYLGKVENPFYFHILTEPKILKNFETQNNILDVKEGDDLDLLCPFEEYDNIIWKSNYRLLPYEKTQHLKVRNMRKTRSGTYNCIASNAYGNSSFEYKINVLTSPTIDRKPNKVEDIRVNVLGTIDLYCDADGNPKPSLKWTKSGEVISEEKDISIQNASVDNGGSYTCEAENSIGKAKKIFRVLVVSKPYVEDDVKVVNLLKTPGESVKLKCNINGSPKPEFFWTKNNHYLQFLKKNQLEIKSLISEDSGVYKCIGSNSYGSTEISFNLTVKDPAHVLRVNKQLEENEIGDGTIRFECVAKGSPLPSILWLKNDQTLANTSIINYEAAFRTFSTIFLDERETIRKFYDPLTLLRSKDSFYTQLNKHDDNLEFNIIFKDKNSINAEDLKCVAENIYGKDEKTIEIEVEETTKQTTREFLVFAENEGSARLEGKFNEAVGLNCEVKGSSEKTVEWTFNGLPVSQTSEDFTLLNDDQILRINSLKIHHQFGLSCQVSIPTTSIKRDFSIKVELPPEWSAFSEWEPCDVSCGQGFRTRSRVCLSPSGEEVSNDKCEGSEVERKSCEMPECVVDGGWSEWSEYSQCSRTCGTGYIFRVRECNNPTPQAGGRDCNEMSDKHSKQYEYCHNPECK